MKPNLGAGVQCKVRRRNLRPRKLKEEKFLNANHKGSTIGLLAMRAEVKKIDRIERQCVIFRNSHLDDSQELCAAVTFAHAAMPGHPGCYFPSSEIIELRPTTKENTFSISNIRSSSANESNSVELLLGYEHNTSQNKDTLLFCAMGFGTDDDNNLVPENMPDPVSAATNDDALISNRRTDGLKDDQSQGWSGADSQKDFFKNLLKASGTNKQLAESGNCAMVCTFLSQLIINLVVKCTSKNLPLEKPLDCGEFLRFTGPQLLMRAIRGGFDKMEHWSRTMPSLESGAPFRFNKWMPQSIFKEIQSASRHADESPPQGMWISLLEHAN